MKRNWIRTVTIGLVVGMAGNLWGLLTCRWLFKWVYDVCRPEMYRPAMLEGRFGWMFAMGSSKLLLGVFMALAYDLFARHWPGRTVRKGAVFGGCLWLLGLLPSKWSAFMSLTMPTGTFLYWVANDLASSLLLGGLVAFLCEWRGSVMAKESAERKKGVYGGVTVA